MKKGVVMRSKPIFCMTLLLAFVAILLNTREAHGQEPVLESYLISHGGTSGARPDGVDVKLTDKYFGNGTARSRLRLKTKADSGSLSLNVAREVGPGEITFALLVFRVEVRGYDSAGSLIYSQDLPGFTFGDSQPGEWQKELNDIPVSIQQIRVVFIGNYE
jgi:hypothetical protein